MSEKTPWSVSPQTESLSWAKQLLQTVPWDQSPEKPLNILDFLNKLHKVWSFNLVSLEGKSTLNLKLKGENPRYEKILELMVQEIKGLGNKVEDISLDPTGFTLFILKEDDDIVHISVSVYRDGYVLIDLHLFEERNFLDCLAKLTV